MNKILLVDDDPTFQTVTKSILADAGYQIDVAESLQSGQERIRAKQYDLVLSDLKMADGDGIELIEFIRMWSAETPVVMITGFASVNSAVDAMRAGAEDYLTKPCSSDELLFKINRVIEKKETKEELLRLRDEIKEKYTFENIIGKSPAIQAVFKVIRQISETDASVLIQGETGTGKELVAKAIHYNSLRKNKPFISVSCAALSEGLLESELFGHEKGAFTGAVKQKIGRFEMANGGTLFLDELGDIPLTTQVKLLRVLQEKQFERVGGTETIDTDIRVISATNKKLMDPIGEGTFREDLYYRLNVMPITLTPLRERREDTSLLATEFVKKFAAKNQKEISGLSPSAMKMLLKSSWPGNVRELENTIERAVILCNSTQIEINHLLYMSQEKETELLNRAAQEYMHEEQLVKLYARIVLNEQNGNKKETCRVLGINFRTLQNRLKDDSL